MPRLKTMEQSLSSLSFICTPICVSSHTYPNLSTNPVDFTFKSRLQPWLISPSLVQTINISCYDHCHSILVSLFPPLCPTSILTGQLEWFFKKGSSKKKKRKFKSSSSSHLIQSKSHGSTLSHVRLSCLFHFKPHWPPCCFLNIAGVLGACTWGPSQWLFPSAWTAPFLQITTWLTHSFLQVFVQKSPLWNLLTTPV